MIILALSSQGICQNDFDTDLRLLVDATSPEAGKFSPNDKPPQFLVYGAWTMGVDWQKDTIDNFEHRLFRNIVDTYSSTELLFMTKHEYPNIRAYGYWGLLIIEDRKTTKEIYKILATIMLDFSSLVLVTSLMNSPWQSFVRS